MLKKERLLILDELKTLTAEQVYTKTPIFPVENQDESQIIVESNNEEACILGLDLPLSQIEEVAESGSSMR